MPRTTKSDVLIPEIFTDAVQGAFAQKKLFDKASVLARTGAVVTNDTFGGEADAVGNEVEVPYFGTLGEFEENVADGTAGTVNKLGQTSEKAAVTRDVLAFEATRWSKKAKGGDAYEEGAQQIVEAAARAMDKRLITASCAAGGLLKAAYSATQPRLLDIDLVTEGRMLFGDEQDNIVAMAVHSAALGDLYRLRDSVGRPLLVDPKEDGEATKFMGMPLVVSDRIPTTGSAMSAVTEAGTTPPDVTLAGTPLGPWNLKIIITVGGASNGTAKFKFSTDGGSTYSAEQTVPNGGGAFPLIDTAIDSLVGVNGKTGITATFTNGTYNADNVYTAKASLKVRSLLIKSMALGFWYNRSALVLQTDKDILVDSAVAAMHLYAAAIRYRRRRGGTKPGVCVIEHNATV